MFPLPNGVFGQNGIFRQSPDAPGSALTWGGFFLNRNVVPRLNTLQSVMLSVAGVPATAAFAVAGVA